MLDGVHMDLGRDAVLPATAGLQEGGQLRQGDVYLHAGLGHHVRLHRHTRHPRPRPQRYIYCL